MKKINYVLLSATVTCLLIETEAFGTGFPDLGAWSSAGVSSFANFYGITTQSDQDILISKTYADVKKIFDSSTLKGIVLDLRGTSAEQLATIEAFRVFSDSNLFDDNELAWILDGITTPSAKKAELIKISKRPATSNITKAKDVGILNGLASNSEKKKAFTWFGTSVASESGTVANASMITNDMKTSLFADVPNQMWADREPSIPWFTSNKTKFQSAHNDGITVGLSNLADLKSATTWWNASSANRTKYTNAKMFITGLSSWSDRLAAIDWYAINSAKVTSFTGNVGAISASLSWNERKGMLEDFASVAENTKTLLFAGTVDKPKVWAGYTALKKDGIAVVDSDVQAASLWYESSANRGLYKNANDNGVFIQLTSWADKAEAAGWYAGNAASYVAAKNALFLSGLNSLVDIKDAVIWYGLAGNPSKFTSLKSANLFDSAVSWANRQTLLDTPDLQNRIQEYKALGSAAFSLNEYLSAYGHFVLEGIAENVNIISAVTWWKSADAQSQIDFDAAYKAGILSGLTLLVDKQAAMSWYKVYSINFGLAQTNGLLSSVPWTTPKSILEHANLSGLIAETSSLFVVGDNKVVLLDQYIKAKADNVLTGLSLSDARLASIWYAVPGNIVKFNELNSRVTLASHTAWNERLDLLEAGDGSSVAAVLDTDATDDNEVLALQYHNAHAAGFLEGLATGADQKRASEWYAVSANSAKWAIYKSLINMSDSWSSRKAILDRSDLVDRSLEFASVGGDLKKYLSAYDSGILNGLTDLQAKKDAIGWYSVNFLKFTADVKSVLSATPWNDKLFLQRADLVAEVADFKTLNSVSFAAYIAAKDGGVLNGLSVVQDKIDGIIWHATSSNAELYKRVRTMVRTYNRNLTSLGSWELKLYVVTLGDASLDSALKNINLTSQDKDVFFKEYMIARKAGLLTNLPTLSDREAAVAWYKADPSKYNSTIQTVLDQSQGWAKCLEILSRANLASEMTRAGLIYGGSLNNANFLSFLSASYAADLGNSDFASMTTWYQGLSGTQKAAIQQFVANGFLNLGSNFEDRKVIMGRSALAQEMSEVATKTSAEFKEYIDAKDSGVLSGLSVLDKPSAIAWHKTNSAIFTNFKDFYNTSLNWTARKAIFDRSDLQAEIAVAKTLTASFDQYIKAKDAKVLQGLVSVSDLSNASIWYADASNQDKFMKASSLGLIKDSDSWDARLRSLTRGDLNDLYDGISLFTVGSLTLQEKIALLASATKDELFKGLITTEDKKSALAWYQISAQKQSDYIKVKNANILDFSKGWLDRLNILNHVSDIDGAVSVFGGVLSNALFLNYVQAKEAGVFLYILGIEKAAAIDWYLSNKADYDTAKKATGFLDALVNLTDLQAAVSWYKVAGNPEKFATAKDFIKSSWSFAQRQSVMENPNIAEFAETFKALTPDDKTEAVLWVSLDRSNLDKYKSFKTNGFFEGVANLSDQKWMVTQLGAAGVADSVTSAMLSTLNSSNNLALDSVSVSIGELLHRFAWATQRGVIHSSDAPADKSAILKNLILIEKSKLTSMYDWAMVQGLFKDQTDLNQSKILSSMNSKSVFAYKDLGVLSVAEKTAISSLANEAKIDFIVNQIIPAYSTIQGMGVVDDLRSSLIDAGKRSLFLEIKNNSDLFTGITSSASIMTVVSNYQAAKTAKLFDGLSSLSQNKAAYNWYYTSPDNRAIFAEIVGLSSPILKTSGATWTQQQEIIENYKTAKSDHLFDGLVSGSGQKKLAYDWYQNAGNKALFKEVYALQNGLLLTKDATWSQQQLIIENYKKAADDHLFDGLIAGEKRAAYVWYYDEIKGAERKNTFAEVYGLTNGILQSGVTWSAQQLILDNYLAAKNIKLFNGLKAGEKKAAYTWYWASADNRSLFGKVIGLSNPILKSDVTWNDQKVVLDNYAAAEQIGLFAALVAGEKKAAYDWYYGSVDNKEVFGEMIGLSVQILKTSGATWAQQQLIIENYKTAKSDHLFDGLVSGSGQKKLAYDWYQNADNKALFKEVYALQNGLLLTKDATWAQQQIILENYKKGKENHLFDGLVVGQKKAAYDWYYDVSLSQERKALFSQALANGLLLTAVSWSAQELVLNQYAAAKQANLFAALIDGEQKAAYDWYYADASRPDLFKKAYILLKSSRATWADQKAILDLYKAAQDSGLFASLSQNQMQSAYNWYVALPSNPALYVKVAALNPGILATSNASWLDQQLILDNFKLAEDKGLFGCVNSSGVKAAYDWYYTSKTNQDLFTEVRGLANPILQLSVDWSVQQSILEAYASAKSDGLFTGLVSGQKKSAFDWYYASGNRTIFLEVFPLELMMKSGATWKNQEDIIVNYLSAKSAGVFAGLASDQISAAYSWYYTAVNKDLFAQIKAIVPGILIESSGLAWNAQKAVIDNYVTANAAHLFDHCQRDEIQSAYNWYFQSAASQSKFAAILPYLVSSDNAWGNVLSFIQKYDVAPVALINLGSDFAGKRALIEGYFNDAENRDKFATVSSYLTISDNTWDMIARFIKTYSSVPSSDLDKLLTLSAVKADQRALIQGYADDANKGYFDDAWVYIQAQNVHTWPQIATILANTSDIQAAQFFGLTDDEAGANSWYGLNKDLFAKVYNAKLLKDMTKWSDILIVINNYDRAGGYAEQLISLGSDVAGKKALLARYATRSADFGKVVPYLTKADNSWALIDAFIAAYNGAHPELIKLNNTISGQRALIEGYASRSSDFSAVLPYLTSADNNWTLIDGFIAQYKAAPAELRALHSTYIGQRALIEGYALRSADFASVSPYLVSGSDSSWNKIDAFIALYKAADPLLRTLSKDVKEVRALIEDYASRSADFAIVKPYLIADRDVNWSKIDQFISVYKASPVELRTLTSDVASQRALMEGYVADAVRKGKFASVLPYLTSSDNSWGKIASFIDQYNKVKAADLPHLTNREMIEGYANDVNASYFGTVFDIGLISGNWANISQVLKNYIAAEREGLFSNLSNSADKKSGYDWYYAQGNKDVFAKARDAGVLDGLALWSDISIVLNNYKIAGNDTDKVLSFAKTAAYKRAMLQGYAQDDNKVHFNSAYSLLLSDFSSQSEWAKNMGAVLAQYAVLKNLSSVWSLENSFFGLESSLVQKRVMLSWAQDAGHRSLFDDVYAGGLLDGLSGWGNGSDGAVLDIISRYDSLGSFKFLDKISLGFGGEKRQALSYFMQGHKEAFSAANTLNLFQGLTTWSDIESNILKFENMNWAKKNSMFATISSETPQNKRVALDYFYGAVSKQAAFEVVSGFASGSWDDVKLIVDQADNLVNWGSRATILGFDKPAAALAYFMDANHRAAFEVVSGFATKALDEVKVLVAQAESLVAWEGRGAVLGLDKPAAALEYFYNSPSKQAAFRVVSGFAGKKWDEVKVLVDQADSLVNWAGRAAILGFDDPALALGYFMDTNHRAAFEVVSGFATKKLDEVKVLVGQAENLAAWGSRATILGFDKPAAALDYFMDVNHRAAFDAVSGFATKKWDEVKLLVDQAESLAAWVGRSIILGFDKPAAALAYFMDANHRSAFEVISGFATKVLDEVKILVGQAENLVTWVGRSIILGFDKPAAALAYFMDANHRAAFEVVSGFATQTLAEVKVLVDQAENLVAWGSRSAVLELDDPKAALGYFYNSPAKQAAFEAVSGFATKKWDDVKVLVDQADSLTNWASRSAILGLDDPKSALSYFMTQGNREVYDKITASVFADKPSFEIIREAISDYITVGQNADLVLALSSNASEKRDLLDHYSAVMFDQVYPYLVADVDNTWTKISAFVSKYQAVGLNIGALLSLTNNKAEQRLLIENYKSDFFKEVYDAGLISGKTVWSEVDHVVSNYKNAKDAHLFERLENSKDKGLAYTWYYDSLSHQQIFASAYNAHLLDGNTWSSLEPILINYGMAGSDVSLVIDLAHTLNDQNILLAAYAQDQNKSLFRQAYDQGLFTDLKHNLSSWDLISASLINYALAGQDAENLLLIVDQSSQKRDLLTNYIADSKHKAKFATVYPYLGASQKTWGAIADFIDEHVDMADSMQNFMTFGASWNGAYIVNALLRAGYDNGDFNVMTQDAYDTAALGMLASDDDRIKYFSMRIGGIFESISDDSAQSRYTLLQNINAGIHDFKEAEMAVLFDFRNEHTAQERLNYIDDVFQMHLKLKNGNSLYYFGIDVSHQGGLVDRLIYNGLKSSDIKPIHSVLDLKMGSIAINDAKVISERAGYLILSAMGAFDDMGTSDVEVDMSHSFAVYDYQAVGKYYASARNALTRAVMPAYDGMGELWEKRNLFSFTHENGSDRIGYIHDVMQLDFSLTQMNLYPEGASIQDKKTMIDAFMSSGIFSNNIENIKLELLQNLSSDLSSRIEQIKALIK